MKLIEPHEQCPDMGPVPPAGLRCDHLLYEFADGQVGHSGSHNYQYVDGTSVMWWGPDHPIKRERENQFTAREG